MVPSSHRESTRSSSYRKASTCTVGRERRCICNTVSKHQRHLQPLPPPLPQPSPDPVPRQPRYRAVGCALGGQHGVQREALSQIVCHAAQEGRPVVGHQLVKVVCRRWTTGQQVKTLTQKNNVRLGQKSEKQNSHLLICAVPFFRNSKTIKMT